MNDEFGFGVIATNVQRQLRQKNRKRDLRLEDDD